MGKVVLIPVDASDNSEKAFNCKFERAAATGLDVYLKYLMSHDDKVFLLHMYRLSDQNFFCNSTAGIVPLDEFQKIVEKEIIEMDSVLTKFESICLKNELSYKLMRETGPIGQGICQIAKNEGVDCIIIGSRGLNKVRRTVLGSISNYVLHHAHMPVTVVPP